MSDQDSPGRKSIEYKVEQCSTEEILPLRLAVLRDGTVSRSPRYGEDDSEGTVHFAVRDQKTDELVGTSTWLPRPWQGEPTAGAMQLRGMAVAHNAQGRGLGGVMLATGIQHAKKSGAKYVWARARDSALYFYERHGFTQVGEGFIDETTGLSHHLVVQVVT